MLMAGICWFDNYNAGGRDHYFVTGGQRPLPGLSKGVGLKTGKVQKLAIRQIRKFHIVSVLSPENNVALV